MTHFVEFLAITPSSLNPFTVLKVGPEVGLINAGC